MRVTIENLGTVECDPFATVSELRQAFGLTDGVWLQSSRGGALLDNSFLGDVVGDDGFIKVNCELLGGAKKRKKKTYTTPKKIKHKNKKVRLAVLRFYKVDPNGEVTRLRKECPGKNCGAGVFMANHRDRTTCGRCGMTYVCNKK